MATIITNGNDYKYKLGFIGAGNMARAIAKALIDSDILSTVDIAMADPLSSGDYCGIRCYNNNNDLYDSCEYVIIAIKPQIYNDLKYNLADLNATCVISIMAGINIADLTNTFISCDDVVRVMPNSPSMVRAGMTAIAETESSIKHKDFLSSIFSAIGEYVYLPESDFDTVTAISGSGPAYYYMYLGSMIDAAMSYGLSRETATKLVCATAKGSIEMIESTNTTIDNLVSAVCSKGGTTIQAVDSFRAANLDEIVKTAVDKARKRSIELSK